MSLRQIFVSMSFALAVAARLSAGTLSMWWGMSQPSPSSSSSYVPPEYSSSIFWYKFDQPTNASGVYTDYSAIGTNWAIPDPTAGRTPVWSANEGGTLYFDGNSDNLKVRIRNSLNDGTPGTNYTLSIWIKYFANVSYAFSWIGTDGTGEAQRYISFQTGPKWQVINSVGGQFLNPTTFPTGTWQHVTLVGRAQTNLNQSYHFLYTNGIYCGSGGGSKAGTATYDMVFGALAKDVTSFEMVGFIGDIYCTRKLLTSNEIYQMYLDTKATYSP